MPAPPPNGVSSTLRCRSVAKSRMFTASSDHTPPPARARPATARAARKHLGEQRQHGGAPGHRRRRHSPLRRIGRGVGGRKGNGGEPAIVGRTTTMCRPRYPRPGRSAGERHQQRRPVRAHLQADAGAVVVHCDDRAERRRRVERRQPEQVGEVEFLLVRLGQAVAIDIEPGVGQLSAASRSVTGTSAPSTSSASRRHRRRASAARSAARCRRPAGRIGHDVGSSA